MSVVVNPIALSLALLLAAPQPNTGPVRVQRPGSLNEAPPVAETPPAADVPAQDEPAAATDAAPDEPLVAAEPEPPVEADSPTVEDILLQTGRIDGVLTDGEAKGVPRPGLVVQLHCTCLDETFTTTTNDSGRFAVEGLPAGIYTIVADQGGGPSEQVVALSPGDEGYVELVLEPPTTTIELDERRRAMSRAQTMVAGGGLMGVTALLLLIGSAVENAKHECKFGLEDCAGAPRPSVTRGLAISGAVLAAGGAALVGVGVHRLRKLRAGFAADDNSVALTLTGRF